MQLAKKYNISCEEVEDLVLRGQTSNNKLGIFINSVVRSHRTRINRYVAKRYNISYEDLVAEASRFILDCIHTYDPKRGRLTTFMYTAINSFLLNYKKKHFDVKRRIPINQLSSLDTLITSDQQIGSSELFDPRSLRGILERTLIEEAKINEKIVHSHIHIQLLLDKVYVEIGLKPKFDHKKVLELIIVGHSKNQIKKLLSTNDTTFTNKDWNECINKFQQYFGVFENEVLVGYNI